MKVPVCAPDAAFRIAVAELPTSATPTRDERGAVVVVRSVDDVAGAVARGASAIVVADGASAASARGTDLLAASTVPLVISRPRLRRDDEAALVTAAFSYVSIDVAAACAERADAAADAMGWARELLGGPLAPRAGAGGLALLDGPRGEAVAVRISETAPGRAAALRIEAVGEVRVRIDAGEARGAARIAITDAAGTRIAPTPWESPERHALRRALAAVAGERITDAADLAADVRAAAGISGTDNEA